MTSPQKIPAAVLVYSLLVFASLGVMFAFILSIFQSNTNFSAQVLVRTRLAREVDGTMAKLFGFFQKDSKHPGLAKLEGNGKEVSYSVYADNHQGYVYAGKSDVFEINPEQYPEEQFLPTILTIANNSSSQGTLYVVSRVVTSSTGFIESSKAYVISAGSSTDIGSSTSPIDLRGTEGRITKTLQISLSSDQNTLYSITPNSGTKLVDSKLNTAISDTEKNPLTGQTSVVYSKTLQTQLKPESRVLASQSDFSIPGNTTQDPFSSSISFPGVSSAFIDTFDLASSADWTTTGAAQVDTTTGKFILNPNANNTTTVQFSRDIVGDFDMRTVISKPNNLPEDVGVYVIDGANTLKVTTLGADIYKEDTSVSPHVCIADSPKHDTGYATYDGSVVLPKPTGFSDGSAICAASNKPILLPYQGSSTYTLRIERKGIIYNAYYCDGTADCDQADNFTLINQTPLSYSSSNVQVGFYTSASQSMSVDSFRITRLNDASNPSDIHTFVKTLSFEKSVKIKKVDILGYFPALSTPIVTLNDTDYSASQHIIPNELSTQSLAIKIKFHTTSGDLSEIPFVEGIRVYYE